MTRNWHAVQQLPNSKGFPPSLGQPDTEFSKAYEEGNAHNKHDKFYLYKVCLLYTSDAADE